MASFNDLQSILGIHFRNETLLKQAFIHPSFINENPGSELSDNERMEFLGDALLNLIVAQKL
ncbi:MAG: ribonuclease III, partial [Chloroflexi bacterium]|nr:ribonuclease III [Chloroflexota bacterium]